MPDSCLRFVKIGCVRSRWNQKTARCQRRHNVSRHPVRKTLIMTFVAELHLTWSRNAAIQATNKHVNLHGRWRSGSSGLRGEFDDVLTRDESALHATNLPSQGFHNPNQSVAPPVVLRFERENSQSLYVLQWARCPRMDWEC